MGSEYAKSGFCGVNTYTGVFTKMVQAMGVLAGGWREVMKPMRGVDNVCEESLALFPQAILQV